MLLLSSSSNQTQSYRMSPTEWKDQQMIEHNTWDNRVLDNLVALENHDS